MKKGMIILTIPLVLTLSSISASAAFASTVIKNVVSNKHLVQHSNGWLAPVLKSNWEPNADERNFSVLQKGLGLDKYGNYVVNGENVGFTVSPQGKTYEVDLLFTVRDENKKSTLKQSHRGAVVSKELLKFYFGKEYTKVWNYINNAGIPDTFNSNNRTVKVFYNKSVDNVIMEVGYPHKPF